MKILLAVDGSPFTQRMLDYLATHEALIAPAKEVSVITAVPPVPRHVTGYIDKASVQAYYDDEAEAVIKPVREFIEKRQWKASYVTAVGNAADVISKAASEGKFDLLMMGSQGHSAIGSLVMGSVTARVMAHCATPVLIVR